MRATKFNNVNTKVAANFETKSKINGKCQPSVSSYHSHLPLPFIHITQHGFCVQMDEYEKKKMDDHEYKTGQIRITI